jgi:hypothetical protein
MTDRLGGRSRNEIGGGDVVSSVWGSSRRVSSGFACPAELGYISGLSEYSNYYYILSGWFWVGAGGRYFFDRLGFAIIMQ